MALTRPAMIIGSLAAAVVTGGFLYATAPPTNLVDAPAYPESQELVAATTGELTPTLTSFYDDAGWAPGPPGELVRGQEITDAPKGIKMYRIIYQSTDLQGNAIPVSGLYAAPDKEPPPGGFPLVGFAHGTTGVGRVCGISQDPLQPRSQGYGSAWVPHMKPMVEQGWAVVASDYSGMGAPGPASYLVGPLEGRGVLDSIRAVTTPSPQIGSVPINTSQLGIYGKSQGGEAALSAMQLKPTYAPELDIAGGVVLAPGLTPAIQGVLDAVASNPTSTSQNMFVLLIAKSYAQNFPDLVNLDDILTPAGKERVKLLDTMCGSKLAEAVSDVPLSQLINQPLAPGLVTALGRGMPGTERLQMPIVVVQGLEDKTILPQFTNAEVMAQCALGTTVFYVRYPYDTHPTINYQARLHQPSVIDWMQNRWAGQPAPSNCANQLLGTVGTATGVTS